MPPFPGNSSDPRQQKISRLIDSSDEHILDYRARLENSRQYAGNTHFLKNTAWSFRNSREGFMICDPSSLKEMPIIVLGILSVSITDTPNIYKHIPDLPRPFGYSAATANIVLSDPISFGESMSADFTKAIQNIGILSSTITFPTFANQWTFHRFLEYESLHRNQIELNIPFFRIKVNRFPSFLFSKLIKQ